MADYSRYGGISADWNAYIAKNPLPEIPANLTPIQLRDLTNAGREAHSQLITKSIDSVKVQDFSYPTTDGQTIPLRVYQPVRDDSKYPVYVYFHGGGFLFGTLSSEDGACYQTVKTLGVVVVNICYRHTPEWKWPAAADDAFAGLNWVFDNIDAIQGDASRVIVGGRSAGATLAAGVTLREKDVLGKNRVRGQILDIPLLCHSDAYPWHLIAPGKSSYEENKDAPVLPLERLELFNKLVDVTDPTDRYFSVLLVPDSDVKDLPRTYFQIAGRDILRDEGFLYMEKLKRAGVPTNFSVYPGVPHGFRRFDGLEASIQWDMDFVKAFRWLLEE